MKHPRRAAILVTGVARATASPWAEFLVPLHTPAPPVGVVGSADGADVLWSGNVVTPSPSPAVLLRAVIRPV